MLTARRGVTLVELLVTVVVGGIALSLVAGIALRQQRVFADMANLAAVTGQLRETSAILPIDLRSAASAAGDIREARDTSIELRATIASAVVCDTTASGLLLAPDYTGSASAITAGDSAWLFDARDSGDVWKPRRIMAATTAPSGQCAALGPTLSDSGRNVTRIALTLDSAPPRDWTGAPMRVTRVLRYSLYRSSDGSWNLGERDWNPATSRFNTIQPVSGPFLSAASGGLVFRYADSTGAPLATPVVDPRRIALIRFDLRGQTRQAPRVLTTRAVSAPRVDSTST
ncbi:MAG TPA: prepilin-type N-terminal cleavage/methylation domain-containing protein, partial [Gemmatimonadaceae bacterium]